MITNHIVTFRGVCDAKYKHASSSMEISFNSVQFNPRGLPSSATSYRAVVQNVKFRELQFVGMKTVAVAAAKANATLTFAGFTY